MNYVVENFKSINELIYHNATRKPNRVFNGKKSSSETGDERFTKTKNYAEAVDLFKNGYAEPLAQIKKGVEVNSKGLIHQKTAVRNDIVGYAPCVPAAIMGIPKSMINKDNAVKKSKIISIIHDATSNCNTSTSTFIRAGIATLSIINSLEASGYRVALSVAFKNSAENKERAFATVNLKDWRQPLDLKKMAFPFCHPSMLRRIGFKWLETTPNLTESNYFYGYGRSLSGTKEYHSIVNELKAKKLIGEHDAYINIDLCERNNFDPQKIAQAAGLKI